MQARTIDRVLDAHGGDRPQVRQKIGAVVPRETCRIAAAEAQCARGEILARERHQGCALEIGGARKQQMVIRPDEGS